ncbi:portal protein [Microbacterium phage Caron]|uniref:Portal protein n=1 Tax=Microbacterium phage Caron TaxID=3028494 RepID=A0AAE9ZTE4_9CAUD|nr:portal protein [Microbacterium phage Caron]
MAITPKLAEELDGKLEADLQRDGRLGLPKRYLEGDHDDPYMPKGAKAEFKHIAQRSKTNWLALIPTEFSQALALDGFRTATNDANEPAWRYFQDNGLDARQTITHRGALEYGTSYVLVLPGTTFSRPVIKPLSPLRSAAWYEDEDDDFPYVAIRRLGRTRDGKGRLLEVYQGNEVVTFTRTERGEYTETKRATHKLGVVPFVRFRDRLDGAAIGIVRPFKGHQDRINEAVFNILVGMQYASFRQRWATGLAIPTVDDPDDPDYGKPLENFEAAVNRLWVSDSHEAKFGDFAQTQLSDHHAEYKLAVSSLAAAAQIDADLFAGNMTNVTGEALYARRHKTNRKIAEYQLLFGESWEQVFRLASRAAGEPEPPAEAEVRWRDTTGEVMTAKVEALAKLATELGVPSEALWDEVPGVTDSKLQRWRELNLVDPLDALTAEIARQTAPTPAPVATPEPTT